jgi:hypothetical protein
MANIVDIILKANTAQATAGIKGFGKELDNVVRGLTGFSLSGIGVTAAIVAMGNELKKAVNEYSDYATAMGKAAELSGITAEEMSRLVQAADDVFVSQEKLTAGFNMALKNGFVPTIENLAKLSDELLAIEDPAQRAEKASKIFGRQWAELAPFLLQGGDAIRRNTAAIEDGLIVTDQAVQENLKYKKSIDDWNDSITALKNTIAGGLLPILTTSMNAVVNFRESQDELRENVGSLAAAYGPLVLLYGFGKQRLEEFNAVTEEQGSLMRALPDTLEAVANATSNVDNATQGASSAIVSASDAMRKYNTELLFNIASQGLDADAALGLAASLGLVDGATLNAIEQTNAFKAELESGTMTANEYISAVVGLNNSIQAIQNRRVDIDVYINEHGNSGLASGQLPSGYTDYLRAEGGPVTPGQSYIVGEQGPEVFTPGAAGFITPNDKLSTGQSSITVNVYATINNDVDATKWAGKIAQAVQRRK